MSTTWPHFFEKRRSPSRNATWFVWCLLAFVLLGCPRWARAGSGGIVTLPTAGTKIRSGLKIQIDTRWVDGTGYRPVRIRVSPIPPGPAPADRSIEIMLRPRSWRMGTSRTSVTQTVELAQGAMYGEATMSIPHYEMWNSFTIETREDGARLRDLSVMHLAFPVRSYYNWSEATPSVLFLDKDAPGNSISSSVRTPKSNSNELPDIRALASRLQLNSYNNLTSNWFNTDKQVDDADILRLLLDLPRTEILPPENLSDRWIDLSCIDLIVLSFEEVERIAHELPATWQAIRDWQASGATLCVFGVGEEYENLAALEKYIAVRPIEPDKQRPYARGWTEPPGKGHTNQVHALKGLGNNGAYYSVGATVTAQGTTVVSDNERDPPSLKRFLIRNVRQGTVVALSAENPFPGEMAEWAWLLNSLTSDDWMWYRRHGFSMHRENPEYWDLLIPGVGLAPVNSFLVLITLFVVIIGPVNYFFLQRRRRLYLILVTVPLGAIIVTASLLVYALVTDGLGVRMRTRSITEIDQPSGQLVSWSRQSYYAGLSPADGLSYPADAVVHPVEHRPLGRMGYREGRNQLVWEGKQRLASGFLTTRSTKQFLVVESRLSSIGLTVDETTDPPRLTNGLPSVVDHVILRTSDGNLFAATGVASAATADLVPTSADEASKLWGKLIAKNRPKFPPGFNPYKLENAADFFESYNLAGDVDPGMQQPTFKNSIFERRVHDLMTSKFSHLAPRAYLASSVEPVEVSVGIENAREEAGFHLIMGRW